MAVGILIENPFVDDPTGEPFWRSERRVIRRSVHCGMAEGNHMLLIGHGVYIRHGRCRAAAWKVCHVQMNGRHEPAESEGHGTQDRKGSENMEKALFARSREKQSTKETHLDAHRGKNRDSSDDDRKQEDQRVTLEDRILSTADSVDDGEYDDQ